MKIKVIKRTDDIVDFDISKIHDAIYKANTNSPIGKKDKLTKKALENIVKEIKVHIENPEESVLIDVPTVPFKIKTNKETGKAEKFIGIEDIQDLVEDVLRENKYFALAVEYSIYRQQHEDARLKKSEFMSIVRKKIVAEDVQNQNANVDERSFGGRKGEADSELLRRIALTETMSKLAKDNHLNNEIYTHDMDSFTLGMHNCDSIPLDHMAKYGVKTRQAFIRPANSVGTFFQLDAVYIQLQSLQQFGGCSFTHLDWSAVPYVKKSFNKHYRTVKDILDDKWGFIIYLFTGKEREAKEINILDTESIMSPLYRGKHWWNLKKRYTWYKSMRLLRKEIKQGVEGLYHNLNTLQSRAGNQLPFSSINYGTCTSPEGRLIIKALLEGSLKGTGNGETSIFPCGIFQSKLGINRHPGDPNYDMYQLAIKSSVRRLYPNYANCDWSQQKKWVAKDRTIKEDALKYLKENDTTLTAALKALMIKDEEIGWNLCLKIENDEIVVDYEERPFEIFSTMGCRTANGFDINFTVDYYLDLIRKTIDLGHTPINMLYSGAQKDGRGNICPVTIIMPTTAMIVKTELKKGEDLIEKFFERLDTKIYEAKTQLIERYNWICSQSPDSAKFMWENNTMLGYVPEEGLESAMKHGTLAIGQIGLAETLQILIGKDHTEKEGMDLAIRIESLFAKRCDEFKEEYKLNFGVYYTPAENLCFTSYKKFVNKYGLIENVTAKKDSDGKLVKRGYFTNSIHVPVWKKMSPFQKIAIESKLTGFSSAGCITYVEFDENAIYNEKGVMQVVDNMLDNDLPYNAINVPDNRCCDCGYKGKLTSDGSCPKCGSKNTKMLGRVTGYITGDYRIAFNLGKQSEFGDRFDHSDCMEDWYIPSANGDC